MADVDVCVRKGEGQKSKNNKDEDIDKSVKNGFNFGVDNQFADLLQGSKYKRKKAATLIAAAEAKAKLGAVILIEFYVSFVFLFMLFVL